MPDYFEGLDGLQSDMAEHQRRFRGEVTAESNRALAADAIRRLENEQADSKPVPPPATPTGPAPILEESIEHREVNGRNYTVSKSPDDKPMLRVPTAAEAWALAHMMPRVELLMTKHDTGPLGEPSWSQRLMAVFEIKSRVPGLRLAGLHGIADDLERRFTFELLQLLEDSNRVFGEWKADTAKTISIAVP